jgi:curved DNA-binding protein CbpA
MENNNLYDILDLNNNATAYQIKKKFKKLALKYHPDKNKEKNANEKFNQIRIAYEILSDSNKKKKYDNMIDSKKKHFTDTIFLFIKEITNPKTIHNMMCRPDIIQDIKDGNINKIAQKMIQKILDNIDLDFDIEKLTEIFIHSPCIPGTEAASPYISKANATSPYISKANATSPYISKANATSPCRSGSGQSRNCIPGTEASRNCIPGTEQARPCNPGTEQARPCNPGTEQARPCNPGTEEASPTNKSNPNNSDQIDYNTSDYNTLNIFGNIKTNLDDIYHNRLKEIIITRKVYENNKFYNETNKYNIPLYDPRVIISEAGDKIIDTNDGKTGDVILKIYCKKDSSKKMIRDNYDIIYNDSITLYELFNGFNKNISYFGSDINICSETPFQEYKFDGNKITIIISNRGLPYDQDNNRGDLIINLYLKKEDDFDAKLKKHFN